MQFKDASGGATLVYPVSHEHVTALVMELCPQFVFTPHIFGMATQVSENVKDLK